MADTLEPEEQIAADALAGLLGAEIRERDIGGVQGSYEFDLILPDERRCAVEVTRAADEDAKRLMGAANREYPAPGLSASWGVSLPTNAELKVKAIMRALPPFLAVLERQGVTLAGRFDTPGDPDAAEAATRIVSLGVNNVWRLNTQEPDGKPIIRGGMLSSSGGADPDALNALVALRANAKRKQLSTDAAQAADQRHLFVWVEQSDALMAMIDLRAPPPDAPELPPEIDVVWAAAPDYDGNVGVLYRLPRGGQWERVQ